MIQIEAEFYERVHQLEKEFEDNFKKVFDKVICFLFFVLREVYSW